MSRAFDYHSPSVITIPFSVKNIDNDAFFFANTKTTIIESKDISIGLSAFEASSLESLYFTGTKDEWSGVSKGNNWCLSSKLGNDPAVKQVTLKVANGKWNDGTTADRVITVVGNNANKLIEQVIPAVGNKPNENYGEGSWNADPLSAELTGDTTFTYTYEIQLTLDVTVTPESAGSVSVEGTYAIGNEVGLTATPGTYYVFDKWTENGETVSTDNSYIFTVTGSRHLTAEFKLNICAVNLGVNPQNGGTIVYGGGTYLIGNNIEVYAKPNDGYLFTGWTENGKIVSTDNPYKFTVEQDRTLVANFDKTIVLASVVSSSDGEELEGATLQIIDPNGNVITEWVSAKEAHRTESLNTNIEYTLRETVAPEGFQIATDVTFTIDDSGKITSTGSTTTDESGRTVIVVSNDSKQLSVGVTVSPTEGGSVSGGGSYTYGQSVTVSATVNNGYVFLGWYRGDDKVTDDPSYSFTVSADIDLIAKFRAKEVYTVIWQNEDGSVIESKTYTEGEDAPTTDIIPTKADDDRYTYTFEKWDEGTVDGKTTTYRPTFTAVPKPVYTVAGEPAAYAPGTSGDLTVTVNREPDDDKCFDHFTGVELDGKALTEGTDFTAAKGSTVITVKAAALENLAEGEHTVKVLFDDGEVETKITVKAAEQTNPATGDGGLIFVWVALTAVSGAVLAIAYRKKRIAVR
jgi:hypothetical protein